MSRRPTRPPVSTTAGHSDVDLLAPPPAAAPAPRPVIKPADACSVELAMAGPEGRRGVYHVRSDTTGATVMVAYDSRCQRVARLEFPATGNHVERIGYEMWRILDVIDPSVPAAAADEAKPDRPALAVSAGGNTGEPAKVDRRRKPRQPLALVRS